MVSLLRKSIRACNILLGGLAGLLILVIGFMLFYEVVCRYIFSSPTIWAQESAIYLYTWAMLMGSAYTLQQGKHVRIDLVIDRMPPGARALMEFSTEVVAGIFCIFIACQSCEMIGSSLKYFKTSPTPLEVPMWIIQLPLLPGFTLLALQFFLSAVERLSGLSGNKGA